MPVEQLILPVDGKQQTLSQDRAHINFHVRSDFPFLVAFPHIHSNVTGFSTLSSACTAHTSHAILLVVMLWQFKYGTLLNCDRAGTSHAGECNNGDL